MIQPAETRWNTHAHHVSRGLGVGRVATAHCGIDHCGSSDVSLICHGKGCPRYHNSRGREVLAGFVPAGAQVFACLDKLHGVAATYRDVGWSRAGVDASTFPAVVVVDADLVFDQGCSYLRSFDPRN